MFVASRVPSGHGFPATAKTPQPYGLRLAKLSSWAARENGLTPKNRGADAAPLRGLIKDRARSHHRAC